MQPKVLVINGHPDPRPERLCAALCDAYAKGATANGVKLRRIDVGALDFDLIRDRDAFEKSEPAAVIREAQAAIRWADHVVLIHPLWLGAAPAVLKGFFEQVFRYGFAMPKNGWAGGLKGKSAHVIVTMGMPAPVYRLAFGGFGIRGFERGVLRLAGVAPIRTTYLGGVETDRRRCERWLEDMAELGARAA